jgi:hypothetical protein
MITKIIKPKKVLFDGIYFDSTAEYHTYLMLSKYFKSDLWSIGIHCKLIAGRLQWKIDFCITPRKPTMKLFDKLTVLASTINNADIDHPVTQLWIEYKGIQDDNFIKKMGEIKLHYPKLSDRIILCSQKDTAFGIYSDFNNKFLCHPIISCYHLDGIIKRIIP